MIRASIHKLHKITIGYGNVIFNRKKKIFILQMYFLNIESKKHKCYLFFKFNFFKTKNMHWINGNHLAISNKSFSKTRLIYNSFLDNCRKQNKYIKNNTNCWSWFMKKYQSKEFINIAHSYWLWKCSACKNYKDSNNFFFFQNK